MSCGFLSKPRNQQNDCHKKILTQENCFLNWRHPSNNRVINATKHQKQMKVCEKVKNLTQARVVKQHYQLEGNGQSQVTRDVQINYLFARQPCRNEDPTCFQTTKQTTSSLHSQAPTDCRARRDGTGKSQRGYNLLYVVLSLITLDAPLLPHPRPHRPYRYPSRFLEAVLHTERPLIGHPIDECSYQLTNRKACFDVFTVTPTQHMRFWENKSQAPKESKLQVIENFALFFNSVFSVWELGKLRNYYTVNLNRWVRFSENSLNLRDSYRFKFRVYREHKNYDL